MPRLLLNGLSPSSILLKRLEQARRQQVSALLLSGFDFDDDNNAKQDNNDNTADVREELFVALQSYIFESRHLEEIILHNCHGGDQLQMLVATILQSSTASSLTIRYDKQQSKIPSSIVNGFLQGAAFSSCLDEEEDSNDNNGDSNRRLKSLSFRGMQLSLDNVRALAIALRELPWLESLSFKCNFPLEFLNRLPDLSLFQYQHSTVSTTSDKQGQQSSATMIMKELIDAIQNMPLLETLELEDCHLCDQDMAQLFYVLQNASSPRIRTLKLRGNRCQKQSMESLSHWLSNPNCELRYLDLSWQHRQKMQQQEEEYDELGRKIANHPPHVRSYGILGGFQFLAEALAYNHSLETLWLSQNRIKSAYMGVLSEALSRNTALRELVIKDCYLSLKGLALLAQNLRKFHLQTLNLNGSQRLGSSLDKAKELLFRPMTRNVHLQELILPGDDDDDWQQHHLHHASYSSSLNYLLEWNRAGRKVLLDPTFPDYLWPTLLARADRIGRREQRDERRAAKHGASAVYYLLREKLPELMGTPTTPTTSGREQCKKDAQEEGRVD